MAELASAPASASFVHALAGETEGNPFFIEEVVRHIRDTSGALSEEVTLEEAGVPEGVREVTSRRLRRLTEPTRAVLLVASVIGREFDYDVLAAVVSQGDDELVEALEEGVEARVLREIGHVGRYGFTHALVRATLYDSISQLRRARLHGRVGEALVSLRGGDLDPHLAMLAHHFAQAAPVERPDRAIDFALAAARRADRMLAWEEAAQHYRAALRARELSGAVDDHVRAELLLALGASEDRAGLEEEARETFSAAIRTARQLGDPVLLTRGALGRGGAVVGAVALGSRAGRAARRGDGGAAGGGLAAARAAARAHVAGALLRGRAGAAAVAVGGGRRDRPPDRRPADAGRRAWTPATTRCGGPRTSRSGSTSPPSCARVAEETGDPELELQGAGWTIIDLMELGDIDGVDIQIAAASKLAEALHRPIWLWWTSLFRGARAQLDGRFDEAERLAQETLAIGQRGQAENALHYYAQAMYYIRREQGRLAEVEGAVRGFIELYPAIPAWRSALWRCCWSSSGARRRRARSSRRPRAAVRGVPARRQLADRHHADGRGLRRAGRRRARGGALRAARALRGPQRGRGPQRDLQRLAPRGCSGCWPPRRASSSWPSGHFDEAQRMHAAMGAPAWHARTQVACAEMLLARRARVTWSGRRRCWRTRSWWPTRWGWSCWPSGRGGSCRRLHRRSRAPSRATAGRGYGERIVCPVVKSR